MQIKDITDTRWIQAFVGEYDVEAVVYALLVAGLIIYIWKTEFEPVIKEIRKDK